MLGKYTLFLQKKFPRWIFENFILAIIGLTTFLLVYRYSWHNSSGNPNQHIIQSDGKGYYSYLPYLFLGQPMQGIPDIANKNPDLNRVNKYFVGTAIAMSPFFGIACGVAYCTGEKMDGYSMPFQKAIGLAAWFYLLLGLYFLKSLLKLYKIRISVIPWVLFLIVFGTNLLMYTVDSPSMSHVYSFSFISIFLFLAKKYFIDKNKRFLYLNAFVLGLIILIRPINILVILALPFLSGNLKTFKESLVSVFNFQKMGIVVLILGVLYFLQSYLWYQQTGKWSAQIYEDEGFNFLSPKIWEVLFGFRKGLFIYTPLALLGFIGILSRRKFKFELISYLLFFGVLIYFISSWWNWYYGSSFGQRALIDFYALVALGLAFLLQSIKSKAIKISIYTLCFLFMGLNLVQSTQYYYNIITPDFMNFGKYRYTFLQTSDAYINSLGGYSDILPYQSHPKLIIDVNADFEKENSMVKVGNTIYDKEIKSRVCDYSKKEFNCMLEIPTNQQFTSSKGLFAEISLDRKELETNSCSSALVIFDICDSSGSSYYYNSFPVNEYPDSKTGVWKTWHYSIHLNINILPKDKIRIYLWNRNQKPFYIDNFKLKLYRLSEY